MKPFHISPTKLNPKSYKAVPTSASPHTINWVICPPIFMKLCAAPCRKPSPKGTAKALAASKIILCWPFNDVLSNCITDLAASLIFPLLLAIPFLIASSNTPAAWAICGALTVIKSANLPMNPVTASFILPALFIMPLHIPVIILVPIWNILSNDPPLTKLFIALIASVMASFIIFGNLALSCSRYLKAEVSPSPLLSLLIKLLRTFKAAVNPPSNDFAMSYANNCILAANIIILPETVFIKLSTSTTPFLIALNLANISAGSISIKALKPADP